MGYFVHPAAIVETASIGDGTRIWAFAHVLPGARIGRDCNIGDHCYVEGGARVGNCVTLKNNVCIWEGISLEDDVFIGPNATFTNDRYPRSPRSTHSRDFYRSKSNWLDQTIVERGATVGANATLLPGIRIGSYSLIAAGATVTRDVAPFSLMVGCPARQVGHVCRCGIRILSDSTPILCPRCGASITTEELTLCE